MSSLELLFEIDSPNNISQRGASRCVEQFFMTLSSAGSGIIISQVNYMFLQLDEFLRLLNWILL
jgi:hypothetical protein